MASLLVSYRSVPPSLHVFAYNFCLSQDEQFSFLLETCISSVHPKEDHSDPTIVLLLLLLNSFSIFTLSSILHLKIFYDHQYGFMRQDPLMIFYGPTFIVGRGTTLSFTKFSHVTQYYTCSKSLRLCLQFHASLSLLVGWNLSTHKMLYRVWLFCYLWKYMKEQENSFKSNIFLPTEL